MKNLTKNIRRVYIICALVLLVTEILIGLYAHGWVRAYLGDVLVIPFKYLFIRSITLHRPDYKFILPTAIFLFSFAVELLQMIGIADILGIDNMFIRTLIGTSFSVEDILCYIIGSVPLYVWENIAKKKYKKNI